MVRLISSCVPSARQRRLQNPVLLALLALLACTGPLHAQSFDIQRITVNSAGEQANAYSPAGALSADGRYVVFGSRSPRTWCRTTPMRRDRRLRPRPRRPRTTTRVSGRIPAVSKANGPQLMSMRTRAQSAVTGATWCSIRMRRTSSRATPTESPTSSCTIAVTWRRRSGSASIRLEPAGPLSTPNDPHSRAPTARSSCSTSGIGERRCRCPRRTSIYARTRVTGQVSLASARQHRRHARQQRQSIAGPA